MTTVSITRKQKKQVHKIIIDTAHKALEEAILDKDGIQRLIANGGELQADFLEVIKRRSVEEVASTHGYPSGYKIKHVSEQVCILRGLFPGLGPDKKGFSRDLPSGAEGFFAIPRWDKIATYYNDAVDKVLAMIASRCAFCNGYESQREEPFRLRRHWRTSVALAQAGEQQNGDTLIIPAQFGMLHRGQSVRRAHETFSANEFGLGVFEVGCMLLTHPERLSSLDDLHVECAGDWCYILGDKVRYDRATCFYSNYDRIEFFSHPSSSYSGYSGPASGFLPQ